MAPANTVLMVLSVGKSGVFDFSPAGGGRDAGRSQEQDAGPGPPGGGVERARGHSTPFSHMNETKHRLSMPAHGAAEQTHCMELE